MCVGFFGWGWGWGGGVWLSEFSVFLSFSGDDHTVCDLLVHVLVLSVSCELSLSVCRKYTNCISIHCEIVLPSLLL